MCQKHLLIAAFTFMLAPMASATNYLSPVPDPLKKATIGGYFAFSSIATESDAGSDFIDRKILGGTYSTNLSKKSAVGLGFGYALKAEAADGFSGSGFNLAASYLREVYHVKKAKVFGYGGFEYLIENYKSDALTGNLSYLGLKGGASLLYPISKKLRPYAAFDLFLLNSGTFKVAGTSNDIKRDSLFTLRVGTQYLMKKLFLRPELVIVGERSIILAVGKKL